MFKCYVQDIGTFKLFLKLNDTDYVDVLLNKGMSSFISNSPSLFGCYSVATETTAVFEPLELRIPVKLLEHLLCEGSFYVEKLENDIRMSFYDIANTKVGAATFVYQTIFTDSYEHKLNLLANTKAYGKPINMQELYRLCKISKTSSGVITLGKGLAGSTISKRGRVFYIPSDNLLKEQQFSISASSMLLLLKLSQNVFSAENFLGASKNGLTLLATKCRGDSNDGYELLEEAKAKFRCDVDIERVVNFIKNTKININALHLDIEQRICTFEQTYSSYEIPFAVANLEKSPKATLEPLVIPISIINEISSGLDMNFTIEKKKNFSKITQGNMLVYF